MSKKIATLDDFRDKDEGPENRPDPATFFAGGEQSGISVQGDAAASNANPVSSLIDRIFRQAASRSNPEEEQEAESSAPKKPTFSGTAYKLGDETTPSAIIADEDPSSHNHLTQNTVVKRRLTFWRDGFSIEDGPLYRYDDPNNRELLAHINRGRAPLSIMDVLPGQSVDVSVEQRMQDDYVPPKKPAEKFGGSGQRLGSISAVVNTSVPIETTAIKAPLGEFKLDQNKPITSIQLRLADGTRLVAKFNHDHTINDLRNFVLNSRPNLAGRNFILQTLMPMRELSDPNMTLQQAEILNSVVVQRFV